MKSMGPSGGMVDAGDSKSPDGDIVPVRVRPWVPLRLLEILTFNN